MTSVESRVEQIFEIIPTNFDNDLTEYVRSTGACQFNFEKAHFFLEGKNERVSVARGKHPSPVTTVTMSGQDFVDFCSHKTEVFGLVDSGRVSVEGDFHFLVRLFPTFLLPSPEVSARLESLAERFRAQPRLDEIPSLRASSIDEAMDAIVEAAHASQPLLIKGALDDFAMARWSLDDFRREIGHFPIRSQTALETGTLADFIERVRHDSKALTMQILGKGELLNHIDFRNDAMKRAAESEPEVFMSAMGASSSLHRDMSDGLSAVFFGKRKFVLFSPDQAHLVYPKPTFTTGAHGYQYAKVRPMEPDYERFPLYREAKPLELVMENADLLFVPFGWFHYVEAVELSATVRFNFDEHWPASASKTPEGKQARSAT